MERAAQDAMIGWLTRAPVVPVLTLESSACAVRLAEIFVEAGLSTIEITLRTPAAAAAIFAMSNVAGAVVGAGTVRCATDVRRAVEAGAKFCVSPGLSVEMVRETRALGAPLLAGVASASELMVGLALGLTVFKFFPAAAAGGPAAIEALAGPFPDALFCPTGGVSPETAPSYLGLRNVLCVGGSWIAPPQLVVEGRWDEIRRRAQAAAQLRPVR